MTRLAFGLMAGTLMLLAGCSSMQGLTSRSSSNTTANASEITTTLNTEAPDVQALGIASLPKGKCGMLLWTLEAGEPVLVFRAIREEGAEMMIEQTETDLVLVREAGEARFGMSGRQEYTEAETVKIPVKVTVDATFGLSFDSGIYVESGLITLVNSQGWERVLPVAGLTGCRT